MMYNRFSANSNVADVEKGYMYWFDKLLAYCLNIFEYDNLPDTLKKKEIESNLLLTGHCLFFESKKKLIVARSELTGFDIYYNPTKAIYSQFILGSGNVNISELDDDLTDIFYSRKKGVCVYNCDLEHNILGQVIDGSISSFISRYARQLADIESTINISLVNKRATFVPTASNDTVKQSVSAFFKKLIKGERAVIVDSNIMPNLKTEKIFESDIKETINDLLIARDKILEQFYREIGVLFYQTKKAQVNSEEVNVNQSMLLISIDDMLDERRKGIEKVNNMFGTDIEVRISKSFRRGLEDGTEEIL